MKCKKIMTFVITALLTVSVLAGVGMHGGNALAADGDNAKVSSVDNSASCVNTGIYKNGASGSGIAFQLLKKSDTEKYSDPAVELTGDAVKLITQVQDSTKTTLVPKAYRLATGGWISISDASALYNETYKTYDLSSLIDTSYLTGLRLCPQSWNNSTTSSTDYTATSFSIGFNNVMQGQAGFDAVITDNTPLPRSLTYTVALVNGGVQTASGTDTNPDSAKSATLRSYVTNLELETGSDLTPKDTMASYSDTMDFPVQTARDGTNYAKTELASVVVVDGSTCFNNPYYDNTGNYKDSQKSAKSFSGDGFSTTSNSVQYLGYMKDISIGFDTDTPQKRAMLALTKGVSLTSGLSRVGGNYSLTNPYFVKVYYTTNKTGTWTLANPTGTATLERSYDRAMVMFTLASDEYVTGIRVVPDDNFYAYGGNELSASSTGMEANSSAMIQPYELPDVGLLTSGATPAITPVLSDRAALGMFTNNQRLAYSGTFSYTDVTGTAHSSTFSGSTSKLTAAPTLYLGEFSSTVSYSSATSQNYLVYQGQKTTATVTQSYTFNVGPTNTAAAYPGAAIRPTLYFEISKDYTVADTAALAALYSAKVSYTANHFSNGDGLLVIAYTGASSAIKPSTDFTTEIPLTALPTAAPQDEPGKPAIVNSWIDTPYDQSTDAIQASGYAVKCSKDTSQAYTDSSKVLQSNAAEVLLTKAQTEDSRIIESSEFGVKNYATAQNTGYAATVSNSDCDQDNIFGARVVLNTPTSEDTRDWYFYTQVPTAGKTAAYYDGDTQTQSAASGFSVYPYQDFKVYSGSDGSTEVTDAKTYYTTATSPSMNGLSGTANGTEWKTYDQLTDTEKKQVTFICVYVPSVASSAKISYEIPYRLSSRKTAVGTISSYSTTRYNYKDATSGNLQLSSTLAKNNVTTPLTYTLTDLTISGRVWSDANHDSVRQANETAAAGTLALAENGTPVKTSAGGDYTVTPASDGTYTASVPHTGTAWTLTYTPAGKNMAAGYHAAGGSADTWSDFNPSADRSSATTPALTVADKQGLSGVDMGVWPAFKVTYSWGTSAPSGKTLPTDSGEYGWQDAAFKGAETTYTSASTAHDSSGTWSFSGWSTTADVSKGIESDVAYTGTWTLTPVHSVTFSVDGGTPVSAQTIGNGTTAKEPTAPTKAGYTFGGWYTDTACTTAFDFTTPIMVDTTLYAKWTENTVTIQYVSADSTLGTVSSASEAVGAATGAPAGSTATAVNGYHFVNWTNADSKIVSTDAKFVPDKVSGLNAAATYTANFAVNTYNVVFDSNGGSGSMADQSFNYGAAQNLTANSFTNAGFVFAGWNTAKDGSGTDYADTASVSNLSAENRGSVTLYAKWTESTVTIQYVSADTSLGTVSSASETVGAATGAPGGSTATAVNGYHFVNWTAGGSVVSTEATLVPDKVSGLNAAATYTAHFSVNTYNVVFDSNGGSGSMADQSFNYGAAQNLTANSFTNAGFVFTGWNTAKDGSGTGYADTTSVSNLSAENQGSVTLYAKWDPLVTISYHTGDAAKGAVSPAYEAVGSSTGTVSGSTATAESGYHFESWTDADGKIVSTNATLVPDKTGATYTANFVEDAAVTITYKSADGTMGSVSSSSEALAPATGAAVGSTAAAKSGCHFVSWTDSKGTVVSTDAAFVPAKVSGLNVAAEYTANFVVDTPPIVPDSGTKVTVPVSSDEGSVKVDATVKDGTATISVTDTQIDAITSEKSETGTVKVDVSSLDVKAATVPAKVIAAASESETSTGVEVQLPAGTVTLDKTALAAVKSSDITVSVGKVDNAALTETQREVLGQQADTALVVDVTVLADGQKVTSFSGGSVSVSVPYTPKAGEDTSSLVVWFIKDDGTIEPKTGSYNAATGKFEFQTGHLSQYVLVSFPFKDIPADSWYYGSAASACMDGLFSGTSETTFSPEDTMTRGMLVTVLWRMAGKPAVNDAMSFSDVPEGEWYSEAVRWAASEKLVNGYESGAFGPGDPVTREQLVTILYRYAQLKHYDTTQGGMAIREFADFGDISDYALAAMDWAVNTGLVEGADNRLMPQDSASRAQVAAILTRFEQNVAK